MQVITAPIRFGDTGPAVANLQEALAKFLEKRLLLAADEDARRARAVALQQERSKQTYQEATRKLVALFQEEQHLSVGQEQGSVNEPTAAAMNNMLNQLGLLDQPSRLVIQGRLVNVTNMGLSQHTITLADYDLAGITTIDSVTTKEDGAFEFVIQDMAALQAGDDQTRPDCVFQVLDPNQQKLPVRAIAILNDGQERAVPRLAESEQAPIVLMNVDSSLTVRVTAAATNQAPTEFELLVARLTPFMQGVAFADLKEDTEHFHISFLSQEAGVEKDKIAQLRDAFQQERESERVPAWAFFGLASQNIDESTVPAMPLERLVTRLEPLRPTTDQSHVEEVAKNLLAFLAKQDVRDQVASLKSSVGELLQPLVASEEGLQGFLEAYVRHDGNIEDFWKRMSEHPDFKERVPAIQLNLQLSTLTLNNVGLIKALQQKGVTSTRQLVDVSKETWEALALEHRAQMPGHIVGKDDQERAKLYAHELQMQVELAFPTDVIKKTLQDADSRLFLEKNPEFDVVGTPVERYLHEKGDQAFVGIPRKDEVANNLRRIQRLYSVTAHAGDMQTLIDAQYHSAHQISQLAPEDFSRSLDGKISRDTAYVYHAKATAISEAAAMIVHQFRDLALSPSFLATGGKPDPQVLKNAWPNWESQFGSLDTCECKHCQSVYSPASYFVDLLHILLGQRGGTARKELFRRRPDLKYTKLSCEHTETLIPYIDLVNEVLETYVAQPSMVGVDTNGDTDQAKAARDHVKAATNDTSAFTAEELAANPQHANDVLSEDATIAYDKLRQATFPLTLPFDLYLESARLFLQEQQSSRYEVLATFRDPMDYATWAEYLGISQQEFELLTLPASVTSMKLWGDPVIPAGKTLGEVLVTVDIFLEQTGITLDDLLQLLRTQFANPNFQLNEYLQSLEVSERTTWLADHRDDEPLVKGIIGLAITDEKHPCDLTKVQIRHLNGQFLNETELSRINRFIRLWRKLGCSIAELDDLLTALGASDEGKDLTPDVLRDLAILWQLQHRLQLPLSHIATLVGNMSTVGKESLYRKLFRNKAMLELDPEFALNEEKQTELKNTAEALDKHIPALLAALRISEAELRQIATYVSLNLATDILNLANISKLYRYAVFAKGLGMTVSELVTWLELLPLSPWKNSAESLTTQERIAKLVARGFKAIDFAYIFRNQKATGHTLSPRAEVIAQLAKTLRDGLRKLTKEHRPEGPVVTADFLKKELELIFEPEEVTKAIGILDGTNKRNPFTDLLKLKIGEQIAKEDKARFQTYLTDGEATALEAMKPPGQDEPDVPERFKTYWGHVEKLLLPLLRKTFVQQHLVTNFKTNADITKQILQDAGVLKVCLDIEADTPASSAAFADLYIVLHKFTWLVQTFRLSARELAYFENNSSNFANFNWKTFDIGSWLRIADYVALRESLPQTEQNLLSIFDAAKAGTVITTAIVETTTWNKGDVEHFVGKHAPADFLNEIALTVLQAQLAASEQVGVSIETLEGWATASDTLKQAQDIKRTLKAKYDESAWIEISTKIHNRLRIRLRDALVAYLLQQPDIKALPERIKTSNDLYGYFLIDVEMDACMKTSRLKQAISSVQLFVQRCLMNLEKDHKVTPDLIDAKQWQWMKNYRVWEANRKVFLYPENWIEPELRDNKSPFFKELESELLQGELTNEIAEQKLMNYLEKLHEVARLDICGIYEDRVAQEMHVFGRTFGSPPLYFYRKRNLKTKVWTAWERVPLDIQSNENGESSGVHLIPVVWNRRLYLFWPIFTERAKKLHPTNKTQHHYFEIRLAWSEYRQNKWSSRKTSHVFLHSPFTDPDYPIAPQWLYVFIPKIEDDATLTVQTCRQFLHFMQSHGEFRISCNNKIWTSSHTFGGVNRPVVIGPKQTIFYQSVLSAKVIAEEIDWSFNHRSPLILFPDSARYEILGDSEGEYKIVFPADYKASKFNRSDFIYQDHKRNYFVEWQDNWFLDNRSQIRHAMRTVVAQRSNAVAQTMAVKSESTSVENVQRVDQVPTIAFDQLVERQDLSVATTLQIQASSTMEAMVNVGELPKKNKADFLKPYTSTAKSSTPHFEFQPFFHAHVCTFMEELNKGGIDSLLTLANQLQWRKDFWLIFGPPHKLINTFEMSYSPNEKEVARPYPMEEVDFSTEGAYSLYNWELFFHIPMLIANRLSKSQRFEEATRWYHFVFNPTTNDSLDTPERFWQVSPLRNSMKETIQALMGQLQDTKADPKKRKELENAIAEWREFPFSPHRIARMRLVAYKKNAFMKYLDNLIAQADVLFRQDTMESINLATQYYILAVQCCGPAPRTVPALKTVKAMNYAELEKDPEKPKFDAFSNVKIDIETRFPFFRLDTPAPGTQGAAAILNGTVPSLYFCIPDSEKLRGYWDTLADRLFKIRHCQNIEGIERQLALFEPPIDPALLVRAVAGGVDIGSVLSDLNSPPSFYRFRYMIQKALDICNDLKTLGNTLLSALEKKDAEALTMMRSQHETVLLNLIKTVRKFQTSEAQRIREGLEKTREATEIKTQYYTELVQAGLNESEKEQQTLSGTGMALSVAGQYYETAASLAETIPDTYVGALVGGLASGAIGLKHLGGGTKGGRVAGAMGRFFQMGSTIASYGANAAQTKSMNDRRSRDWKLQCDMGTKELQQIDKQILAAQIREQIAEKELSNLEQQIDNARQVEEFLRNKYTQEELYGWLIGELSTLYFQCYQLTYDFAKKTQQAYRRELGLPTASFLDPGMWEGGRKGLLAGEKLALSLRHMEKSYLEQHKREYEITKHISLLHFAPLQFITLKATGKCEVDLPEALFDMDCPGHYMRRLKNVSVTIPCVVGPYTNVNCTLTLLRSKTRVSAIDAGTYAADMETENQRVVASFAALESIVTSTGQRDSGMFELNFQDERYLPFEGSGAVSTWRIELPSEFRQFDYDTISDVVLHLNYTARQGGASLRTAATTSLTNYLKTEADKSPTRLFSLRHEFPSEWHRLNTGANTSGDHVQAFVLDKPRFPFMFQDPRRKITIHKVEVFAAPKGADAPNLKMTLTDPNGQSINLLSAAPLGNTEPLIHGASGVLSVEVHNQDTDGTGAKWTVRVNKVDVSGTLRRMEDLFILCHYSVK